MKKLLLLIFLTLSFIIFPSQASAQVTDDCKDIGDPQKRADCYSAKLKELQGQKKTLSSQIAVMDSQIRLTESRIAATQLEVANLALDIDTADQKIDTLEQALDGLTKILLNRIVVTYQVGRIQPFEILFSSTSASSFISRLNYLRIAQAHDKEIIYQTQQAKSDYTNQKDIFEAKKTRAETLKASLDRFTVQLNQERASKQNLLAVTNNDEVRFQQLLREAQAQIESFKSFAGSQGGPNILPAQASPDGWFYNQRDERWGRGFIGASSEQVWEVGCLVTATAMVLKQKGVNVTPADVAANNSYYFSDTAFMLIPWNGGKFTSIWTYDQSAIDSRLANGDPVIVGLKAGPFGTHFIVLKSGSNGDYIMNDPWNGVNLKFSDYYSVSQIYQYGYYSG